MEFVDSHCHIISDDESRYPRAPLGGKQSAWATTRPLTAEQLVRQMDAAGVTQAVLVQATTAYGYDNSYVLDSSRRWPGRFVFVGTFDPLAPRATERLAEGLEDGLVGVRLFTTGSTMTGQAEWFADRLTFEFWQAASERALPVCLQMRLGPATARLRAVLERFPDATVLLDHCGYPDIAASPQTAGAELAVLSQYPGLHLKLTHRSLEPLQEIGDKALRFLEPVIEAFGSDRIAWGSNCPAAEQPLSELVELATRVLQFLPDSARADIFGNTSLKLYPALRSTSESTATNP